MGMDEDRRSFTSLCFNFILVTEFLMVSVTTLQAAFGYTISSVFSFLLDGQRDAASRRVHKMFRGIADSGWAQGTIGTAWLSDTAALGTSYA